MGTYTRNKTAEYRFVHDDFFFQLKGLIYQTAEYYGV